MAVNFLNEQSARNVSNIDNTTKNLLQGAALVLSSASKDTNTKVNTDFFSLKKFSIKVSNNGDLMTTGFDFGSKGQGSSAIKKGRCLYRWAKQCNLAVPLSRIIKENTQNC